MLHGCSGQDGRQLFDTMPYMEADFFLFNFLDNSKHLPPCD